MLSRWLYKSLIRPFVVAAVNLLWVGRVEGIENIPRNSGAILASNHSSFMDFIIIPSIITAKLKRPTYILAAAELTRRPVVGIFARNDDCILIDRTKVANKPGAEFYKESLKALGDGNLLLLFPEGTRSPDGKVQMWKKGFVKMAIRANVPIVPVTLKGTFDILPKGGRFVKFGKKADVVIHRPVYLEEYFNAHIPREKVLDIAESVREEVISSL